MKHAIVLAVLVSFSGAAMAADSAPTITASTNKSAGATKRLPFMGKVSAVDVQGGSITLVSASSRNAKKQQKGSVVIIDKATKIIRGDEPATLADIKIGDRVSYSIHRTAQSTTFTAATVRIEPAEEKK